MHRSLISGFAFLWAVLSTAAVGGVQTTAVAADAPARAPAFIPLSEIRPGMTGYGLTVFAGDRIDTFAVRAIGIQDRSRAAGSLLLIKVSGHGLETSGIAQGMSGSPVFLDGRLAGALAFGWGGSLQPIAGVTPVGDMAALPTDAVKVSAGNAFPGYLGFLTTGAAGEDLGRRLGWPDAGFRDVDPVLSSAGDPWPAADALLKVMAPELGRAGDGDAWPVGWFSVPPAAAGTGNVSAAEASPADAGDLAPGAACAIPLIMGDALLGVVGTVTWLDGDAVYMMGHPFLQRGPVRWPLATARVLTILPSRQMSFKMAGIGEPVGAVLHDQRSGMTGRLGEAPPMIPVMVTVADGGAARDYAFSVVDDRALTPGLVFWCLYNSLLVQGNDASDQTVRYRIEQTWAGDPELEAEPLVLSGAATGPGGAASLAGDWMATVGLLLQNRARELKLRGLTARLDVSRPAARAAIVGLDHDIGQGAVDTLTCRVRLQLRRGASEVVTIGLPLPAYLASGDYKLVAASEADLFALESRRLGEKPAAVELSDLVRLLRRPRSADGLVVALVAPGGGIVAKGREYPHLPGSRARLLDRLETGAHPPLAHLAARRDLRVPWVLEGSAVVDLVLDRAAGRFTARPRP